MKDITKNLFYNTLLNSSKIEEFTTVFTNLNMSISDMVEYYSVSKSVIYQVASHLKLKRDISKKDISLKFPGIQNFQDEIIQKYLNFNHTISELSIEYNVNRKQINNLFKYKNIDIQNVFRKYTLNESYFKDIDSFDKAYFLGLICADGWVLKNTNYLGLSLVEEFPILLEKLNKYIGSNRPIKKYINKQCTQGFYYRLDINSKIIVSDLDNLGITQNKTFTLQFPNIKDEFLSHFIRGHFDGDGSGRYHFKIGKKLPVKPIINFLGTESFLTTLADKLSNLLNVKKAKIHKSKNIYSVTYSSKNDVLKIYDFMYNNKKDLFLERKFKKFIMSPII
jgi:hypothetical protein